VCNISNPSHPLIARSINDCFKIYLHDVGILKCKSNLDNRFIITDDHNDFTGAIAENFVAQQISSTDNSLFYFAKVSTFEMDFIIEKNGDVFPIEVKFGKPTKLNKSLVFFKEKFNPKLIIRLSQNNLKKLDE
jgi:predicted AAA+ superfamily ATPase